MCFYVFEPISNSHQFTDEALHDWTWLLSRTETSSTYSWIAILWWDPRAPSIPPPRQNIEVVRLAYTSTAWNNQGEKIFDRRSTLTSYKLNVVAVTLNITVMATFLPRQPRFPAPNVKSTSRIFRILFSHSTVASPGRGNHRSGTNWSASDPKIALSAFTTHAFIPTNVPGGRNRPSGSWRPSVGTTRSSMEPIGGWTRRASEMMAVR